MTELRHYILEFATIIVSLFAFYLLKNYWPKYFERKAENQATKEDIGEITEIIEHIKSDLAKQNEFLKAKLSLANQHKLNLKSAEREAMLEFNKQKSAWIYSLLRFSFYKYHLENYRDINLAVLDNQKRQYEYDLAAAHLTLFTHDNEFIGLKSKLIDEVLELDKILFNTIYDLFLSFSRAELNLNLEKDQPSEQAKIRYTLNEELISIITRHKKIAEKQFEKVNRYDLLMRELLCNRLKILEDATIANAVGSIS
ncbi:hypothetical protein [Paraflavitalea sp. CAU 1676]|uniref:hypothetical protein n=1 Tax=Paraflavitalea sp. CAU 1676 TaxID=3032598 RepID=UPI0023D9CD7F|nr:hypothetical protein [Paraflavitalea sp. CAU 1676]MDF2188545.1 hypothetical protein [Paraflavitalea sp. CAU 1676]